MTERIERDGGVGDNREDGRTWRSREALERGGEGRVGGIEPGLGQELDGVAELAGIAVWLSLPWTVKMVFGELVGNAVRHAPGVVDVELTWDDPSTPILHVVDDGPGFASRSGLPNDDAESGRGLFLVECLTRAFSVTRESVRGACATSPARR